MNIQIIGYKNIQKVCLPYRVDGSFTFYDVDTNIPLIIVDAINGDWVLKGFKYVTIKDKLGKDCDKLILKIGEFCIINYNSKNYLLYFQKKYDSSIKIYKVNTNDSLLFGRDQTAIVNYNFPYFKQSHFSLKFENNSWIISTSNDNYVYVNDNLLTKSERKLNFGDFIYSYGLKVYLVNGFLIINNPQDRVIVNEKILSPINLSNKHYNYKEVDEVDFYSDNDYYYNTPRIRRWVEPYTFDIINPPPSKTNDEVPTILTVGPMVTTGITSVVSASNVFIKFVTGNGDLKSSIPQLITSVVSLVTTLAWPNLTKFFNKKNNEKLEAKRKEKYLAYLQKKRTELLNEAGKQLAILNENLLKLDDCYSTIIYKKRTLWEVKISQRDFLKVRVGLGDRPIDLTINFQNDEESISTETDPLKEVASKMIEETKMLRNVPIEYSFFGKKATAIMGKENKIDTFIDNILMQMIAYHSFDELKIVIFTDDANKSRWEVYKELPHLFSNNKNVRFFSTDMDSAKYISYCLEKEFVERITNSRKNAVQTEGERGERASQTFSPYYLIITDNFTKIRKLGICEKVLNIDNDFGFTFLINENRLSHIPSECTDFIILDDGMSNILHNDGEDYSQTLFNDEINDQYDMAKCVSTLANIPIEFVEDTRALPTSLTFLEMYGVGKIEQLNIMNRWTENDPTKSLKAPLGVNDQDNLIMLDLHEKFHGPHGLIAGTTGSGKSEFIITYILSMCVNYSPNEIAFVLIDYKGGGLAGAFENRTTGVRLPHLAGTITNLDKNEMNRTLVSIQSELTRRQSEFNKARDSLGESTIDIYKYQKFFREKKLSEPMPHLFIVCDEFAELKSQQPEFMANLISAARIGRSLGVHLILATQKPSGVVNDQIWSNTKFRICLKVATPGDSNEMLKCPDASTITNSGRFYLQVGQNEIFVLGQSGWCGAKYFPSDTIKKDYDRSLTVIDEVGNVVNSIDDEKKTSKTTDDGGDQLTNILKYIVSVAERDNLAAKNLWLPAIPFDIFVSDVVNKYQFKFDTPTAIIGEYDDPAAQKQGIVSIPLNTESNIMVYGKNSNAREMFIRTFVYSTCKYNSSDDVNFYIMDFGSETFQIMDRFAHVADVIFSSETDRVDKLFKMLTEESMNRKKLFVDYNGDFSNYCKNSGKKLPLMITILNNYDSFLESYNSYSELLLKLSRESKKFGILFMIAASGRSGLTTKFLKNFDYSYVLNYEEKEDYVSILGKIGNILPADYPGRGLFKTENSYEFQTAKMCEDDKIVEFIKSEAIEINSKNPNKAKLIPSLPDKVTIESFDLTNLSLEKLPIGLVRETIKPYYFNLFANKILDISSSDVSYIVPFAIEFMKEIKTFKSVSTIIFDFNSVFKDYTNSFSTYIGTDFNEKLKQIIKYVDEKIKETQFHALIIISGAEEFKKKIESTVATKFNDMIKNVENVNVWLIDDSSGIKKITFETWYSANNESGNGIWIGSGFAAQSIIKITMVSKVHSAKIKNSFGWVVKNSEAEIIKLIGCEDKDEE